MTRIGSALVGVALLLALSGSALADYSVVNLTPTITAPGGGPQYVDVTGTSITVGAQGGIASYYTPATMPDHALLWNRSAASFMDMNPAGYSASDIFAMTPTTQAGDAVNGSGQVAGYWTGSPNSFTALPTGGLAQTEVNGAADTVNGTVFVGLDVASVQALAWTKTGTSPYVLTQLQPSLGAGYSSSVARATDGVTIVGQATTTTDPSADHAVVWNVITHAASDINGSNFESDARSVVGNQIAGYGDPSDGDLAHALLWTFDGTGYTQTDLNPDGASTSAAYATNGISQVGFAVVDDTGNPHAYVWTEVGGVVSGVDLNGTFTSSQADGIDAAGDIVGTATDANGNSFAVLWTVNAPEPASLGVLGIGAIFMMRRRQVRG